MGDDKRPITVAAFKAYLREHKLMATRCTDCKGLHLPPRAICPDCHSDSVEWVETSGKGTLAAFTSINIGLSRMAAQGYDRQNPYCTGIVTLEEGVKISAQIVGVDETNPAEIEIGTPVTVDFIDREVDEEPVTALAFRVT